MPTLIASGDRTCSSNVKPLDFVGVGVLLPFTSARRQVRLEAMFVSHRYSTATQHYSNLKSALSSHTDSNQQLLYSFWQ